MSPKPKKHGTPWTKKDTNQIRVQAQKGVPTTQIAKNLERTVDAIRSRASDENISLKPTDKKK